MNILPEAEIKHWLTGIPNRLTVARIAATPLIVLVYPVASEQAFGLLDGVFQIVGALLFLAAAVTDFLDGYFARKYNLESTVGAILDPVADKLLVVSGLMLLVASDRLYASLAIILIGRELAISGIRVIAIQKNILIEVNQYGKLKTVMQTIGIFSLMISKPVMGIAFKTIGYVSLSIAIGLSLYSAYLYCDELRRKLKINRSHLLVP